MIKLTFSELREFCYLTDICMLPIKDRTGRYFARRILLSMFINSLQQHEKTNNNRVQS